MTHHLLVAEDNVATAQIEKFALESAGFNVTTAANGQEAWDQLEESCFDLVLADEQMPRMTGRELRRRMRSNDRLADIPFILLTAKRWEIKSEGNATDLKIERLLAKPFSPTELVMAVKQALDKKLAEEVA